MRMLQILTSLLILVASNSVLAVVITHGSVSYENTGNVLVDTDGRKYSAFNETGLIHAALTTELQDPSSVWAGYEIIGLNDTLDFINDMLGGASTCTSLPSGFNAECGIISGWSEGHFGDSWGLGADFFMFMFSDTQVGQVAISATGLVVLFGFLEEIAIGDQKVLQGAAYNYLLTKDPETVPEPSAIALMGLGLLGFVATRRKIKK